MLKFVTSIKKKYSKRLLHREEQWPPVRGDKLINLQLVEANKTEGFRAGLPQQGAHEENIKRTPILIGDLFKSEGDKKQIGKLLIEGNGGMGKTTLCTMLAEGWAEGKVLTQYDCVILLPLREKSVSSATALPQLFELLHSSERIRMSAVEELKDNEGDGVLIIADGWDELDDINRSPDSFLYNLLFGSILPFASILLTSRPSASASLHNLPTMDRFVEVVGFNEENIKQYVKSEFEKCPEKASSLIEQLEHNPLVENVCSVPLNCAIICNLWHTLDQVLPSTLTELYTKIVLNVIYRDIKKKFPKFQIGRSLDSFDSIPEQLQEMFWLTCRFAYDCLSRDQFVFSERELASLFPEGLHSNDKLLYFGLLQSAQSLLPVGHGLSFHFLHLTFQEFLAALHLVTLPAGEQLKACKAHATNVRFAMVWRFAFGLGSKQQSSHSVRVCTNVVCFDDNVANCFIHLRSDILQLCHCAFESKDDNFVKKVAEVVNGRFEAVTPHDCLAVYHVLRHTSPCPHVSIDLNGCGLGDMHLTELTDILSSADGELNIKTLDLGRNKLTNKGVTDLLLGASTSFFSLRELYLFENNISDVMASLIHISCISLSELSLSDNPLGVSGIQSLERAVQAGVVDNLKKLHLSNTFTDDAVVNGTLLVTLLTSIASHCPHLWQLGLSRNNLGLPGARALGQSFPHLTTKRSQFFLTLVETELNSEAVTDFAANAACKLSSSFPSTQSCRCTLYLDNNPLGYDGLLAIFRMLKSQMYHIVHLSLSKTDLTTHVFTNLPIQHIDTNFLRDFGLVENRSVENLSLDGNTFSGNRILVLAECIRVCHSLKYLHTRSCSLTSIDVIELISSLKSSGSILKNLERWAISSNSIDGDGVAVLVKHLATLFPSLQYIRYENNQVKFNEKDAQKLEEGLQMNKKAREAKLVLKEAQRSAILTEWERASLPPQSEELLQEFYEMWDELLVDMIYLIKEFLFEDEVFGSDYPRQYLDFPLEQNVNFVLKNYEPADDQKATLEVVNSPPHTPSDDESFHSATEELDELAGHYPTSTAMEQTACPTVQSPHSIVQQGTYEGSQELTLHALTVELEQLSKPIKFGILLKVPQSQLEIIQQNHHLDVDGQKIALFQYIAKNYKSLGITWTSIADALHDVHAGNLSLSIREKYCSAGHGGSD